MLFNEYIFGLYICGLYSKESRAKSFTTRGGILIEVFESMTCRCLRIK